MANVSKSKTINYQIKAICTEFSEEAFSCRVKVEGATYQERLRKRIPFPECAVDLTVGSVAVHHRRLHGTEP